MRGPQESSQPESPVRSGPVRSMWKSRSLRLMVLVTAVGLGVWVYAVATAPTAATGGVSSFGVGTPLENKRTL